MPMMDLAADSNAELNTESRVDGYLSVHGSISISLGYAASSSIAAPGDQRIAVT